MVPASLKRTLASSRGYDVSRVPAVFTLNAGHVTFFYNKLTYLSDRYEELVAEMVRRGMRPDFRRQLDFTGIPDRCFGEWQPSKIEQRVVVDRITTRLRQRAGWYRSHGKIIDVEELIIAMNQHVD